MIVLLNEESQMPWVSSETKKTQRKTAMQINRQRRRSPCKITSTFCSSLCICSCCAWRLLSSRFSPPPPVSPPLSSCPSPSPLSSPLDELRRRTRWPTLTPRSSGLRGEGERARGVGLGESEDEVGKTKVWGLVYIRSRSARLVTMQKWPTNISRG